MTKLVKADILTLNEVFNPKPKFDKNGLVPTKSIFADLTGDKFLYALNKNKGVIKNLVYNIYSEYQEKKKDYPDVDKYSEYQNKRQEIESEKRKDFYADVNKLQKQLDIKIDHHKNFVDVELKKTLESDIIKLEDTIFKMKEIADKNFKKVKDDCNKRLEELNKEYEKAISDRQGYNKCYSDLMNSDINVEFYMIKKTQLPKNITDEQYSVISMMIEE